METITHPTLVQLVAAGAVRVVVAVGQPGGWTLLVRYGLAERALATQRSKQLRVFRKRALGCQALEGKNGGKFRAGTT